jgi:hypothetical protein
MDSPLSPLGPMAAPRALVLQLVAWVAAPAANVRGDDGGLEDLVSSAAGVGRRHG